MKSATPSLMVLFGALVFFFSGCTDELAANCADGEFWDGTQCVPGFLADGESDGDGLNRNPGDGDASGDSDGSDGDSDSGPGDGDGGPDGDGTGEGDEPEEIIDPCEGLECDQVACAPGEGPTTLSGIVHIPSGALPLPNVSVYIPNGPLAPIQEGASCERCEDIVSGNPLVLTTTDVDGYFHLENVPVGTDVPLVMQTGKWRRQVLIPSIEPCQENLITDENLTRMPRSQAEGDLPRIAVSTGGWDNLECLLYKIGVADEEFTTENNPGGRVTLFRGSSGTTRFASDFQGGVSFTRASDWWGSLENLLEYDIVMHSCAFPGNTAQASQALENFTNVGGRAFMTDLHRAWFQNGTPNFQSVASWRGQSYTDALTANIDTTFAGGETLYDWMYGLGALSPAGQFPIFQIYNNINSVNSTLAERWIYSNRGDHYFAFNTPVGAEEADQCGRVVYSDLHISGGGGSTPNQPFPTSCGTNPLSGQELALIYMFFDLSGCIAPECEPITCQDVVNECGVHPNGCGTSIDCGECCVEIEETCTTDSDCCDSLWCDDNTGRCTDRCRAPLERCETTADCCSGVCSVAGGGDSICVVQ